MCFCPLCFPMCLCLYCGVSSCAMFPFMFYSVMFSMFPQRVMSALVCLSFTPTSCFLFYCEGPAFACSFCSVQPPLCHYGYSCQLCSSCVLTSLLSLCVFRSASTSVLCHILPHAVCSLVSLSVKISLDFPNLV